MPENNKINSQTVTSQNQYSENEYKEKMAALEKQRVPDIVNYSTKHGQILSRVFNLSELEATGILMARLSNRVEFYDLSQNINDKYSYAAEGYKNIPKIKFSNFEAAQNQKTIEHELDHKASNSSLSFSAEEGFTSLRTDGKYPLEEKFYGIAQIITGEKAVLESKFFGTNSFINAFNQYSTNNNAKPFTEQMDSFTLSKLALGDIKAKKASGENLCGNDIKGEEFFRANNGVILNNAIEILADAFTNKVNECQSFEEIKKIDQELAKLYMRDDNNAHYIGREQYLDLDTKCQKILDEISINKFGKTPDGTIIKPQSIRQQVSPTPLQNQIQEQNKSFSSLNHNHS